MYSALAAGCEQIAFSSSADLLTSAQRMHREIYLKNPKIKCIVESQTPGIAAAAKKGERLLPLLDDFAQIAGRSIRTIKNDPAMVASSFQKVDAVLVEDGFAVCCGATPGDAQAVSLVVDKNCEAWIAASLFGKPKPIGALDCSLMRLVYQKKYAALAEKK